MVSSRQRQIRPHAGLESFVTARADYALTLPVAFGVVCAAADVDLREAVGGISARRVLLDELAHLPAGGGREEDVEGLLGRLDGGSVAQF